MRGGFENWAECDKTDDAGRYKDRCGLCQFLSTEALGVRHRPQNDDRSDEECTCEIPHPPRHPYSAKVGGLDIPCKPQCSNTDSGAVRVAGPTLIMANLATSAE